MAEPVYVERVESDLASQDHVIVSPVTVTGWLSNHRGMAHFPPSLATYTRARETDAAQGTTGRWFNSLPSLGP